MGEVKNLVSQIDINPKKERDLGVEAEEPKRGPKTRETTTQQQLLEEMTALEMAEMRRLIHIIEVKQDLFDKIKDPRPPRSQESKLKIKQEIAQLKKEFIEKYGLEYGLNFSTATDIIKKLDRQKQQEKDEKQRIRQAKKAIQDADIIQGEIVNDMPPPLPRTVEAGINIPPTDINAAKLAARVDSTPAPKGLWGKFKSWLSGESAYRKFGEMQADSGKTADDLRAEAKGETMMYRQDKAEAKAKAKEERMTAKWSRQAEKDMNKPVTTDEKIAEQFQTGRIDRKLTQMEEQHKEKVMDKLETKANAVSKRDFSYSMKEGSAQAKSDYFNKKAIEAEISGPFTERGRVNMEKYNASMEEMSDRLSELQPIVGEIRLGFFTKLKVDKKSGFITNLPENNENIVFDFLIKQKDKLGAKGKINEANKIVEQMEALEEYTDLLTKREKLKAEAGQLDTERR